MCPVRRCEPRGSEGFAHDVTLVSEGLSYLHLSVVEKEVAKIHFNYAFYILLLFTSHYLKLIWSRICLFFQLQE